MPDHGQPGQHVMTPPAQPAKHAFGVRLIGGFAKHLVIHHHDRVGSDDDTAGKLRGRGLPLERGDAFDVRGRRFTGTLAFVHVHRMDVAGVARFREQLASSR